MKGFVGDSLGFITQLILSGVVPVDRNQCMFQSGPQFEFQGEFFVRLPRLAPFTEFGLARFPDSFGLGSSWDN